MNEKVLLVDDEQNILDGYRRVLRDRFDLVTCSTAAEGLDAIREQGPFAVVLSDYKMPGMNGVQFLSEVRWLAPDTVRIMLTGYANMQIAIDAINDGNIYHFLNKPCSTELLVTTLEYGIEHFRLITSEHKLQDRNMRNAIKLLIGVLSDAPIGIAILRHDLIVFVNKAFLRMFGFGDTSELYYQSLAECIASDCRHEFTERLIALGKGTLVPRLLETIGLQKNGKAFSIIINLVPINVSDSSARVIFVSNINDRTPAEEKLASPKIIGEAL